MTVLQNVKAVIKNMDCLGVKGGCIKTDGKMTAFTLGEQISRDTALIHIEKADSKTLGLYTIINREFVEHEWKDTLYINREEDLGIEGLRKSKLSYNPAFMVNKFLVKV